MSKPAEIFFCGDIHGQFDHLIDVVNRHRPDAIILLGDLEPQAPIAELLAPIAALTSIRWIHGNHCTDCHEYIERGIFDPRFNLHARVETIAGVRIAGLGGVFRGEIWYPARGLAAKRLANLPPACSASPLFHDYDEFMTSPSETGAGRRHRRFGRADRVKDDDSPPGEPGEALESTPGRGRSRKHLSSIFPADFERLKFLRADVLVCHEAPSCHPHGFAVIDDLARSLGARLVVHGHHHDHRDYSAYEDQLGFKAFGVGFCGVSDLSGALIVPGAFDTARHRGQPYPKVK